MNPGYASCRGCAACDLRTHGYSDLPCPLVHAQRLLPPGRRARAAVSDSRKILVKNLMGRRLPPRPRIPVSAPVKFVQRTRIIEVSLAVCAFAGDVTYTKAGRADEGYHSRHPLPARGGRQKVGIAHLKALDGALQRRCENLPYARQ